MKKLLLFLLILLPVFSLNAQTQPEEYLGLDIKEVKLVGDRTLSVDVDVINGYTFFTGDLNYQIELYRGDELNTQGYVFAGLSRDIFDFGKVGRLDPGQTIDKEILVEMPVGVITGNYYIRLSVNSLDNKYSVTRHTKTPIYIEGKGSFMGTLDYSVNIERQMLDLSDNVKLNDYLVNNDIFIIKEYYPFKNNILENQYVFRTEPTPISNSGGVVEIDLQDDNLDSGFYKTLIYFKNSKGVDIFNKINETSFIEGDGIEIVDIVTSTNYYNKGDFVDLKVYLASQSYVLSTSTDQKSIVVEAGFERGDEQIVFTKTVSINRYMNNVSFYNQFFNRDFKPEKMTINLLDSSNGDVINTLSIQLDSELQYSIQDQEIDYSILMYLLYTLGVIVILTLTIFFRKKMKVKNWYLIVLMILIATLYLVYAVANAAYIETGDTSLSGYGNRGICPQTEEAEIYINAFCYSSPTNYWTANYDLNLRIDNKRVSGYGEIYYGNEGPFVGDVDIDEGPSGLQTIAVWSGGFDDSSCGSYYSDSWQEDVWCTPETEGICGSSDGDYEYYKPSGSELCSEGSAGTVTSHSDGSYSWTCTGNTGISSSCSTTPTVDGMCGSANGSWYAFPSPYPPASARCDGGTEGNIGRNYGSEIFTWKCYGSSYTNQFGQTKYAGDIVSCATIPSSDGVCGSADKENVTSEPSGSQLCSAGTSQNLITNPDGTYSWNCLGVGDGDNPSCSTIPGPINGSCGIAKDEYYSTEPSEDDRCDFGSSINFTQDLIDNSWSWNCTGEYGGSTSGLCETAVPECSDGVDNDGDGEIDYPEDLDCDDDEDVEIGTEGANLSCIFNPDKEVYDLDESVTAQAFLTGLGSGAAYSWSGDFGVSSGSNNSITSSFSDAGQYNAIVTATKDIYTFGPVSCEVAVNSNPYIVVTDIPDISFNIEQSHATDNNGVNQCYTEWTVGEGAQVDCDIDTVYGDNFASLGGIVGPDSGSLYVDAGNEYIMSCITEDGSFVEIVSDSYKCLLPKINEI